MRKWLCGLLLVWTVSNVHAQLSMQLDATRINLNQSFKMVLVLDGGSTQAMPDLSPLEQDFKILGTERSTHYTLLNGKASFEDRWVIFLMPKRAGILTVPSIAAGHDKTAATHIEVLQGNVPVQSEESKDAVKLEVNLSRPEVFINQELVYTVKLYNSIRLMDASYQPPTVDDAVLVPLGDGRRYQETLNGRLYTVEEQKYAIFPQKSGSLNIHAPQFSALQYEALPREIAVTGKKLQFSVKPIPDGFKDKPWIPAKELVLNDVWDNPLGGVKQGDTLSRSITLEARGLPAQLLPEPVMQGSDDFSIYQEKSEEKNTLKQEDVNGVKTIHLTYLFNHSGTVVIPEYKLYWYNTETRQTEVATLPEVKLTVAEKILEKAPSSNGHLPEASSHQDPAIWLAVFFALAWLSTLLIWRFKSVLKKIFSRDNPLKAACLNHQPDIAQKELLKWGRQHWPEARLLNLADLSDKVTDSDLKEQIRLLSSVLYGFEHVPWNGTLLWECVARYKLDERRTPSMTYELPPLNPRHTPPQP